MRSTFLGFETARKALMASQKSLDITANNLANVNTQGYTRQRVDLLSVVTTGGEVIKSDTTMSAGQGVLMSGISQVRDPFLDKKYRELNAMASESSTTKELLTDVENVLDNFSTDGINNALLDFKGALQSFATDSTDRNELASILSQAGKNLISVFNDYDYKLKQVEEQAKYEIDVSVGDLNATLQKIATINDQIKKNYSDTSDYSLNYVGDYTVNVNYGPNELLDARNVLLDSLSDYVDIEVVNRDDGMVDVIAGGVSVVNGDKATALKYTEDTSTGAIELVYENGEPFSASAGSIKAYSEFYNGNGIYATNAQSANEGIPYYRSVIDEFAKTIAAEFNAANVDASDPTANRELFVTADGTSVITAGNIRISDTWLKDPMSIIPSDQDGELDNTHIMKLLGVFEKDVSFGNPQDFEGSFDEYVSYYTNKLAQDINFHDGKSETDMQLALTVINARDSISAVSMEEEGTNMMNFQKWFNASARMMTTLDEALNTIISNMGLVGR